MLALLLFTSCIDPLDFRGGDQREHLVVEGSFTNEPGLNYVRLSYSKPYDDPYNRFVHDAEVFVTSSERERYYFNNAEGSGYYYPGAPEESFGTVGHTYTLTIKLNGRTYQSEPALLNQPVPIDTVYFEMEEREYPFPGYLKEEIRPGYRFLVDYHDPAGDKNYLRWTFLSLYQVRTQPQDYITPSGEKQPKSCCVQCYVTESLANFKVTNDRLTDGQQVINQEVLFIPFERYLDMKHKLTVYQHSLTEEAYEFFRIMEEQKQSTGTVFDPPPAQVQGNLYNVNDEDEQVIGFFDVSGVSKKQITILRKDIDYPVPYYHYADDCRTLPGATTEKPADW